MSSPAGRVPYAVLGLIVIVVVGGGGAVGAGVADLLDLAPPASTVLSLLGVALGYLASRAILRAIFQRTAPA